MKSSRSTYRHNLNSPVFRNVLSGLLLAVAVMAIYTQISHVRDGTVPLNDARFSIVAYSLIAVYAIASLIIRMRPQKKP